MTSDVFISYSSKDKAAADAVCTVVEAAGIGRWMAPREITPGSDWSASIVQALDDCRAVVLVFSSNGNNSPQIRNEVTRAVDRGVAIVPVRIENIAPTGSLAYFLSAVHWLDAFTPPLEKHLDKLVASLKSLLRGAPNGARLEVPDLTGTKGEQSLSAPEPVLALPDKPSIAVLPFTNMSGDHEQEYLADGLTEDLTTALSKVRWFFVISRNSSFTVEYFRPCVGRCAQSCTTDPDDPWAHLALGVTLMRTGHVEDALSSTLAKNFTGSSAARNAEHRIVLDDLVSALKHELHATEVSEGGPAPFDV